MTTQVFKHRAEGEEPDRGPERVGEGRGTPGQLLLGLLRLQGWEIPEPMPAFAGDGVLMIATRDLFGSGEPIEIRPTAATAAEAALELFEQATAYRRCA